MFLLYPMGLWRAKHTDTPTPRLRMRSDTIYNNPHPNCVNIVHFGPRVFTTLKCIYMLRGIHTCSTSGTFFLYLMWDITPWISLTPKP